MNQGIIKSLKLNFKKQALLHYVQQIEMDPARSTNRRISSNWFVGIRFGPSCTTNYYKRLFSHAGLREIQEESIKEESLDFWAENLTVYDV